MRIRCGRFKGEDGRWRTRMCPTPGFLCRVRHGRSSGICISSNKFILNQNPVSVQVIRINLINNRELIRISNCSRFRTAGPMLAQTWSCTQKKPWTRNGCCIRTWPWCNETNGKEEKTSKPVPKNWNKLTTNTKRDTRIGRPIKSVDVNSNRSLQLLPFDSQIVLQSLT